MTENIERFIYITKYNDSETMKTIQVLFEQINQKAFNLISPKEIYTKQLTEDEKTNRAVDYISGFQILDKSLRITILEGVHGKGMSLIKERLPKTQVNSSEKIVYADERILYDKRIYSEFNLCLKYIRLRASLNTILTTYDIYSKWKKYPEIYQTFMNFASILRGDTLEIINNSNLFPSSANLLHLERQYADILTEEDITGIKTVKKAKQKIDINNLMISSGNSLGLSNSLNKSENGSREKTNTISKNSSKGKAIKQVSFKKEIEKRKTKSEREMEMKRIIADSYKQTENLIAETDQNRSQEGGGLGSTLDQSKNIHLVDNSFANSMKQVLIDKNIVKIKKEKKMTKSKLDSKNIQYENFKNHFSPRHDHHQRNLLKIEALDRINQSSQKYKRFCTREINEEFTSEVFPYSSQRRNYWIMYFDQQRKKLGDNNNAFYTYSKDYLHLKMPLQKHYENFNYECQQENKRVSR